MAPQRHRVREPGGVVRVVIAEDSVILLEGMVELLTARGCEVIATAGDADGLLAAVAADRPDVAVVDIRMPPTHTDEGIRATERLRAEYPDVGVLVFSQHAEPAMAARLLAGEASGIGYLLKERVAATSDFIDALRRVANGGVALDPEIVSRMLNGRRRRIDRLTAQERKVLDLMAQGHSNRSTPGCSSSPNGRWRSTPRRCSRSSTCHRPTWAIAGSRPWSRICGS
uniref:response regulator n=1 Tax=Spongiactinospora rosea TaxID=2248750 RepID=UPI00384BC53D